MRTRSTVVREAGCFVIRTGVIRDQQVQTSAKPVVKIGNQLRF